MTTATAKEARILVFGQTGQVANALKSLAGKNWFFASRADADLANAESVQKILSSQPWDAVINAAAHTAVDQAESEPELANAINGIAPGIMAQHCAAKNIPFIHVSTDYVFDGSKKTAYLESDPVCPVNVYGQSKLQGEQAIQKAGGRFVILRTSWVYAPEGKNFVKTMIRLAEREELKVVNDQNGAPTAAIDIARAINEIASKMLTDQNTESGIFNLTGSGETSWHGFANEIFKSMKARGMKTPTRVLAIPSSEYPVPAQRPLNSRLDNTKIKNAYGIVMPSWQDSLKECLDVIFATDQEQLRAQG